MHNYLLRYYLAEHGLDPDQDVQIRAVPPPEMVANLRADNIDGFLGPDPMNQRAVYDGVGFIHMLSKDIWEGHPCCAFSASHEFVTADAEHLCRAAEVDHRRHRVREQGGEPQADRRSDRAGELSQPAGHGAGADPDRHLRRRARQGAEGAEPRRLRSVPVGVVRGLDHDPDEALGSDQGRCRLRQRRQAGLSRHRYHAADEGSRAQAADRDHASPSRSWARRSIRRSRRNTSRASRSEGLHRRCCTRRAFTIIRTT